MDVSQIHLIAGARPNFMKVGPLYHALSATDWAKPVLVHTGQHYDHNMAGAFLGDLRLPEPHHSLGIGSGTHAEQTGGVMIAYEELCLRERPDWIVVVGDVNSTAACAMVGAKMCIPVGHLEAGLRSRDRTMPEEINRIVTDAIATLLWTSSADADDNLLTEGIAKDKVECVGNIMCDSFELVRDRIESCAAQEELGLETGNYALVTLHRPGNVDTRESLQAIITELNNAASKLPIVFVMHPRVQKRLTEFDLMSGLESSPNTILVEALPYIRFMNLVTGAKLVVTDSGGLQEETTYLDIPCLTLRDTTERPITVSIGSNRLVTVETLAECLQQVLVSNWPSAERPPLWDGQAAVRVARSLERHCRNAPVAG